MSLAGRSIFHPGGRTGLLLVHGLGGTPNELAAVAHGLAQQGFTVHCPQLAGHCGTARELRATGWRDWYRSVAQAHDRMVRDCETVIVGGLSMGALLALLLAAERPGQVQGAALFAPSLRLDGWGMPWYSHLFSLVHQKWCADLFAFSEREPYGIKSPRLRALVKSAIQSGDSAKAGILAVPGGCMLEMRWLAREVERRLGRIRQPVLILHPRHDDRAALANAIRLQRQLGGRVETVVLDDSYHVITLDKQRHIVIERTAQFARRTAHPLPEEDRSESAPLAG